MSDTILELPVLNGSKPLSGTSAKLVLVNNRLAAEFVNDDDALLFQGILSDKYAGGNINIRLYWITNPYTLGDVTWDISWRTLGVAADYTIESWDATSTVTLPSAGLSLLNVTDITLSGVELGYTANSINQFFQLLVKTTNIPSMGTVGPCSVQLLNMLLVNT